MLQPARQDRKRRENPQALKDRKANLGRQLLYNDEIVKLREISPATQPLQAR